MFKKVEEGFLKIILTIPLIPLFLAPAHNVYASGFAIYTQGASALGQGNTAVAHIDNPSAIFYNPALISKLEGTQIELGTTAILPSREFKSDFTGKTRKARSTVFFPSTLFITHRFKDKFSVGLGVFNPFGLGTDWGDDWEGRYIATSSEIKTFNINPVISYRLTPQISIAAGLDILLLDTTLEKRVNLSVFGLSDAKQKFDGDGDGVGYNWGILFDITKDLSMGLSLRSSIEVDVDGNATHELPSSATPTVKALFPDTGGNARITLPQQILAGIAYKGIDHVTLLAGLIWEGWSKFDELRINLDHPIAGKKASITERDWKDVFTWNIGVRYEPDNRISFMGGYLYGESPVPDSTFDPSIPDADTHIFNLGTEIKYKKIKIGLTYTYQLLEDRTKNNGVDDDSSDGVINAIRSANGEYETQLHIVGLSITYRF